MLCSKIWAYPKKKGSWTHNHTYTHSLGLGIWDDTVFFFLNQGWHSLVLACVPDNFMFIYIWVFKKNYSDENEMTDFGIEWSNIRIKEDKSNMRWHLS